MRSETLAATALRGTLAGLYCRAVLAAALACGAAGAQPRTDVRGVVNGVSFQPAPAAVARGGVLAVVGAGLADSQVQAQATPLPASLGAPAVEVLLNGAACPLYFVSPEQIRAQVPWEAELGRASVVVRRDGVPTDPMPVVVAATSPNLFIAPSGTLLAQLSGAERPSAAALGLAGPEGRVTAAGAAPPFTAGEALVAYAVGLGATNPPAANGAGGSESPAASQRAYLGGLPIDSPAATLVEGVAGLAELSFTVPELADSGEVLHWFSGDAWGAAVLGAGGGAPAPRYMDVPAAAAAVGRIDMTDLNPYFVALSGVLDEVDFCYRDVQLLDFRRNAVTPVAQCLLPSYPEAPNPSAYRPFERSLNCSKLGALAVPAADPPSGYTDQLIVVDGAAGTVGQVALPRGADRLQPGTGASRDLRLRRPDGSGAFDLYTPSGAFAELQAPAPLPEPLDDALTRTVAQAVNFGGGYRMRFLASATEATPPLPNLESSVAVLFGPAARRLQTMRFPPDWRPLIPPQQVNAQGVAVGTPAAPAQAGFGTDPTAYVLVESADGARQGIAAFSASLPATESVPGAALVPPPAGSVSVALKVIEFPAGVFAATCAPQVRWLRLGLTQQLAIVAAGERLTEAALPRDGKTCGGDRLAVFNPDDGSVAVHQAPGSLDNARPGAVRDYLYFGDAGRAVALEAPEKLYVFDAVQEQFAAVELPEDVGITLNALTQALPGQARLVALATGGPPRTNRAGTILPPFPGNRGLLVVDLAAATAQHLALPPGYVRILPGNLRLVQEGRRGFGLIPMLGRAFARAAQPGGGPGNPPQTRMLTWNTETGQAAEVPVPEGGYTVVQARPRGGAAQPLIWDYRPKAASFAFGVFNQAGDAISIGVVGP